MKKKKKGYYAKAVGGLAVGTLGATVGAHALGAIGGVSAGHGQAALMNVSKFAPTMGTVIGVSVPIKIMHEAFPKNKVKRIFR